MSAVPGTNNQISMVSTVPNVGYELIMNPPITVIFICSKCSAGYQATQKPRPEETRGTFCCEVCRTEVYAWRGPYAYLDWQAVETLPPPSKMSRRRLFN